MPAAAASWATWRDQRPAGGAERRGDAGQVQPRAGGDQRFPRCVLEAQLRGGRLLAVVDHAGVARRRPGLEEHQPEPRVGDPADEAGIDPVAPRLAVDDAAERPFRQSRHPGGAAAEPRQQAGDIELGAADPDLEQPRLVEPLHARRRQPQQRLAEGQEVVARDRRRAIRHLRSVRGRGLTRAGRRRRRSPGRRRRTPRRCTERR